MCNCVTVHSAKYVAQREMLQLKLYIMSTDYTVSPHASVHTAPAVLTNVSLDRVAQIPLINVTDRDVTITVGTASSTITHTEEEPDPSIAGISAEGPTTRSQKKEEYIRNFVKNTLLLTLLDCCLRTCGRNGPHLVCVCLLRVQRLHRDLRHVPTCP